MGGAAVQASDLRVTRGRREVIKGIAFSVPEGSVVGLLGPSGSGKTTLMRTILGIQRHVSGELQVLGHAPGDPALRGRIGYMTQEMSVYEDLTIAENLGYFAALAGAAGFDDALTAVQLSDYAGQAVRDLSGGQRTRVSLAAALIGAPPLLVLDEPTVGLDPLLRRDLWALFRQLDSTLVVSSHVLDEADHCDSLLLMRDGELIATGTPAALRAEAGTDDLEQAFIRLTEQREAA
jgi:ABC-2 type transport system ATP-binding protein